MYPIFTLETVICSAGCLPDHAELYQSSKASLATANSGWLFLGVFFFFFFFLFFYQFRSVLFKLYFKYIAFRLAVIFIPFWRYILAAYKKSFSITLLPLCVFCCYFFFPKTVV